MMIVLMIRTNGTSQIPWLPPPRRPRFAIGLLTGTDWFLREKKLEDLPCILP